LKTKGARIPQKACKGCGEKISTAADQCPYCGKTRWKRRYSIVLRFLIILMALLTLYVMISTESSKLQSGIQIHENTPHDAMPDNQNILEPNFNYEHREDMINDFLQDRGAPEKPGP